MTTPALPAGPWLLVPEAADRARCGPSEILRALNNGSLIGSQRKKGATWRVHVDDLDDWVRRGMTGDPARPPSNVTSPARFTPPGRSA